MGRTARIWIALELGVHDDEKTLGMADDLGIDPHQAVGHLGRLWLSAMLHRGSDDVTGLSASVLASWAGWPVEDSKRFLEALAGPDPRCPRWIKSAKRNRKILSGWEKINGAHVRELERKRAYYQRKREGSLDGERQENSGLHNTTLHNRKNTPPYPPHGSYFQAMAKSLIQRYATAVDKRSLPRTERMLANQISAAADPRDLYRRLNRAVDHYLAKLRSSQTEPQFFIEPHNLFGREQKWRLYDVGEGGPAPPTLAGGLTDHNAMAPHEPNDADRISESLQRRLVEEKQRCHPHLMTRAVRRIVAKELTIDEALIFIRQEQSSYVDSTEERE